MSSSRPSGAWATASPDDPFVQARWRLTGLYALLLAAVVVGLSTVLFTVHGIQVRESRDRDLGQARTNASGEPQVPEPRVEEYLEALGRSIVFLDAGTILVGGFLGWWLAGRTLRPIRDSVRAEQRFFADAAHDLRTPLAVMRTEMEVALRDRAPRSDEDRKVLGSALEEIDRMSHLVDEMLLLATTKAARSPTREDADLTDLVQTAVARLEPRARSLGLTLVCRDTPPVIVPLVAADVHRALTNVVENALKFTPLGGTVTVAVEAGRTFVDVTVTDTGRGIAPEDLPRVKDPFYRGESARSTPGSGLGLAIVARILGDHRGTVEVTSTLGQGTRVRLRFPRT